MRDKLIKILNETLPDIDFEISSTLVDDGILDSFNVIQILNAISEEFNINIDINNVTSDDFNCIEDMELLIKRYMNY